MNEQTVQRQNAFSSRGAGAGPGLAWLGRWAALLAAVAFAASTDRATADPFSIVVLPDTQNYVNSEQNSAIFGQQTQWIADQIQIAGNPNEIRFVSHLGDLVSNGDSIEQFSIAADAMDTLDGVVPYSALPGNHDYSPGAGGVGNYLANFGPDRYAGYSWYGGADSSGLNSYQYFGGAGVEFLHLALEWSPVGKTSGEGGPIAWAQAVLDAHPDTPVVLSTHEYLNDVPAGRSVVGEAIWEDLVRHNDQIFMVLGGHAHLGHLSFDGELHQVSTNNAGRPVIEVLQNYQDYPNGGDGWLRIIRFDPENNLLDFETYSATLDAFQTETVEQVGPYASQFVLPLDFESRLSPVARSDGDYNADGVVDASDYTIWRDSLGAEGDNLAADGNADGIVDLSDYSVWKFGFGWSAPTAAAATPEPLGAALLLTALAGVCLRRGRRFPAARRAGAIF